MANSYWFKHDDNARNDEKIQTLIFEMDFEGYGIYWALIEELVKNDGYMQTHYARIAHTLRTDKETVKKIIEDFGLFKVEDNQFTSPRALKELKDRKSKIKQAKKAANARWNTDSNADADADAKQEQSESNASSNAYIDKDIDKDIDKENKDSKKRNKYKNLYDYYCEKEHLINHQKYNPDYREAIKRAEKRYDLTVKDCKKIIDRHNDLIAMKKNKNIEALQNLKIRPLDELFGQRKYNAKRLICKDYLDDGDFYRRYLKNPEKAEKESLDKDNPMRYETCVN